jgi:hypothetical protein
VTQRPLPFGLRPARAGGTGAESPPSSSTCGYRTFTRPGDKPSHDGKATASLVSPPIAMPAPPTPHAGHGTGA